MPSKHTFQSIILDLQNFWAERGCLIWQPYYTQVGAGTMNPATFLRVLGPEPWNVAYVEPSVRPDDGRYGQNPNRYQMHYQYQVILKPDPGDPQELYLDSLKALGIDPRQHDIRFVEDNWEQPAISAWGLGWEVWLDGQEITQFTYFQQVGGLTLDSVAVELTYGLERILIALNNADAIWDEPWGVGVPYGEVRRHEEFEHSKYYFEAADVGRLRKMYDLFEAEADSCLEQGLILPAYDYVLKCSHTFNALDTRGAVGVTERQAFFRKMRGLARRVAEAYLEQRKELEYPLLQESGKSRVESSMSSALKYSPISTPQTLLLEIGVEEMPVGDVEAALTQLRQRIPLWLDELRLEHGPVQIEATPRRLAVMVSDLSPRQSDRQELVKGPPADKAIVGHASSVTDHIYTQAAIGFAKKNGVDVDDLQVREVDGGKYVVAVVKQTGRPTPEVLAEALPGLVAEIKFEKSMRWNDSGVAFSRPIRWLVALLGETIIPFEYAGLISGNVTRGLRPYDSPEIEIKSADRYLDVIQEAGIVLDGEERAKLIEEQVKRAAASVKGEAIIEEDLLAEVTNLVEAPTAVLGGFDKEFLQLPRQVLISVMKKHQRYFPLTSTSSLSGRGKSSKARQGEGKLLPNFIAIRNGDEQYLDLVRQGNEHVLGARFADANFFVREDLKHPLDYYRPQLSGLTFQTKLGSMLDKSDRMLKLAEGLTDMLDLDQTQRSDVKRATFLAKADLVTQMVVEMTSLQGVIGREYALHSGESESVAEAIGEQYQAVPGGKVGLVVALADRLDSLVGLFAAGLAPTGAKDPFALRRAVLGVVQPLMEYDLSFDLREAVEVAAKLQPIAVDQEVQAQVLEFTAGRLSVLLKETGFRYDVVDAVLVEQGHDPASAARAVKQLQAWVERKDWHEILPAFARCVRITRDQTETFKVNPEEFAEEQEEALFKALQKAESTSRLAGCVDGFLNAFTPMIPVVNKFFENVLVMDEDKVLRENRLGLLQRLAALAAGVADMSKLEGF
jgi:glycyl-tRNA synthetase